MAVKQSNVSKVYLDAYDLTVGGLEAMIAAVRAEQDKMDLSNTAEAIHVGAAGLSEVAYSGLHDTTATANFLGLKGLVGSNTARILSHHYGTTIADYAIQTQVKVLSLREAPRHGQLLPLSAQFASQQFPDMGQVLYPKTTLTASTSASAAGIDGAAATSSGCVWGYHVFAWSATGGNVRWNLLLQDDTDPAFGTANTLATVNCVAVGAARSAAVTGAIARYSRLRVELDATSGSITLAAFWRRIPD